MVSLLMIVFTISVVFVPKVVFSYRVLMMPVQLHSHISNFVDVGKELTKLGHEVYTVSYKGYREVDQESQIKTIQLPCRDQKRCSPKAIAETQASISLIAIENKGNLMKHIKEITDPIDYLCKEILTDERFWMDLNKVKFDLVFVDGLFSFRCMFLVPHRLGIPWVTLSDVMDPLITRLPWLPSFVPNSIIQYSHKMTFIERLQNTLMTFAFHFTSFMPPLPQEIIEEYSKYGPFSSLEDLESRSLLWLHTHDNAIDFPRPYMPNVINVGGLSTKPAGELKPPFKQYVESAADGVILVSFGSYLINLPDEIALKFLQGFQRLSETVIWRFENKNNLIVPKNVILTGWLPQNHLLAHANVKVFITHCGNNGQFEGLYHGKPMLGVPLFGDQITNSFKITYLGYGLAINIFDFTSENVYQSIRELVDNSTYRTNIKKASEIFLDKDKTPAEIAAYWIDHVLKFGGKHLRSYALDMPLYEYLMIDIMSVVALSISLVIFILYTVICICKSRCKSKTDKPKKE